uniref:C-type lectin domain-containing protein n=1 Tax=Panagrolaimus sp. PS1159 TaxID=55785 RepID=A0AC35G2G8_9BILA
MMKLIICIYFIGLIAGALCHGGGEEDDKKKRCPETWTYSEKTGFCYKAYYWSDWFAAESICIQEGGHLASVHTAAENSFLQTLAQNHKIGNQTTPQPSIAVEWYTIGLQYIQNKWIWTDKTPVDYLPWQAGYPTGDYLTSQDNLWVGRMSKNDGKFGNGWGIAKYFSFICKSPALKN